MTRTHYLTDVSDAEWNCIASLFPALLYMGVHGFIALVKFSMRSFICSEVDARGVCFPTISLPGKRCTTPFVSGIKMASGNECIQHCASKCVKRWDVKLNQVQASSTGNRVKTIGLRGPRVYDAGKKIKGRKRTYW